ncbi:MAG: hypothetical protein CL610_15020 [Anaerolineaceae bacterium]|nr:hypothetical protein [Anaerolineaceae bacterium]
MERKTEVTIDGEKFLINGEWTYKGVGWQGHPIEGLLFNTRMVQGIFDDLNPDTRHRWAYPDTDVWDADRNTHEFIEAMPLWRDHGVLAFTINLQGGSPQGYSKEQPWINSAINGDGTLRPDYMARLQAILDRADELGMVVILGLFYFGQENVMENGAAIRRAVDAVVDWLFDHEYRNVIIEINNESNIRYQQPLLMPDGVHELIEQAKARTRDGCRFLVGTSYGGGFIPKPNVVNVSDFLLVHGNGVKDPNRITEMVEQTRQVEGYRPMPILFNEDDHFDFDQPFNNMIAATQAYASWGYFDYRMADEGFEHGYQSVPVDWGINSDRKRGFFNLVRQITSGQS